MELVLLQKILLSASRTRYGQHILKGGHKEEYLSMMQHQTSLKYLALKKKKELRQFFTITYLNLRNEEIGLIVYTYTKCKVAGLFFNKINLSLL